MRVFIDVRCAFGPGTGIRHYTTRLAQWLPVVGPFHDYRALALRSLRHCITSADRDAIGLPIVTPLLPLGLAEMVWRWWPEVGLDALSPGCDVYHLTDYRTPIVRTPALVATIHDLAWVRVPQCYTQTSIAYFDRFLQRCVQTAKIIVDDSQATRQDILEYTDVDEAKVRVVHLGVDTYGGTPLSPSCIEETKARYGLHAAYFLMLGETCRRKNIPLALDAIQDIKQRRKDCPTLVLVGKSGDDADRIAGLIRDKGIEDQVRWLGHVPEGDVYPLLAGAIALLYPSLYEGFGLPPLQAMQVGTPVIASSVSSIPEVVGDAGLLMDPTCSGTLTEAMLTVLDDESLRRQLTIRGRLRVRQFTWEKTARSMVAAYEDALS